MISKFNSPNHELEYSKIFKDKIEQKCYMLQQVLQAVYNRNTYVNPEAIDGKTLQVLVDLTNTLTYETDSDFKENYPKYKDDIDEMFLTKDKVKEIITEALAEAHQGDQQ